MQKIGHVQENALPGSESRIKLCKIKCVKPDGFADVYNMEVQDHHNYSVNGGLILHNCDAVRYLVSTVVKPRRLANA